MTNWLEIVARKVSVGWPDIAMWIRSVESCVDLRHCHNLFIACKSKTSYRTPVLVVESLLRVVTSWLLRTLGKHNLSKKIHSRDRSTTTHGAKPDTGKFAKKIVQTRMLDVEARATLFLQRSTKIPEVATLREHTPPRKRTRRVSSSNKGQQDMHARQHQRPSPRERTTENGTRIRGTAAA